MHCSQYLYLVVALLAAMVTTAPVSSRQDTLVSLYNQLVVAPGALARLAILSDSDLVFDFNDTKTHAPGTQGVTTGFGGHLIRADITSFPALYSMGGSMALGFLGPCGFNTPHLHPRANELYLVIQGRVITSMTTENHARHISGTLNTLQMTIFPQGAMHSQWNPDCVPATFVAAFMGEDPGVAQIAQEYFGLEDEAIIASAGGDLSIDGQDVDAFRSKIPENVVVGVESCLAKCKIAKR